MSNSKSAKSDFPEFDKRVGQAWSLHFRRQYDEAISQFRILVEEWPDHIDANYGLALALRWSGQVQESRTIFTKAASLVETALAAQSNQPISENYRNFMLRRMIEQQIESINKLI